MYYLFFKDHWPQPGSWITVLAKQRLPMPVGRSRPMIRYDADTMLHVDIDDEGRWSGLNAFQPWEIEVVGWSHRYFESEPIDDFRMAPLARLPHPG